MTAAINDRELLRSLHVLPEHQLRILLAPVGKVEEQGGVVHAFDEAHFVVERKLGTGVFALVQTLPANTTTWQNTGLTKNTTYTYRVSATNAAGSTP